MPQINLGTVANDGTGSPLRTGGQLINQYGLLGDKTVNAAFYKTASITNEAAITLAITAAALLGTGAAVWVPASMLPYNASLVSFNTAVQMLREAGVTAGGSSVDVQAYGAFANNVADDSAAIQAAINRAQAITTGQDVGSGVFVCFSTGTYLIRTALNISRYITLCGNNYEGTVLNFNLTVPGTCIVWNNMVLRVRFGFGCRELSFAGQGTADGQTLFGLTNCMGIVFSRCMFGGVGAGGGVQAAFGGIVQTSFPMWEHCFFSNCTTCFNDTGSSGSTENIVFTHCSFSQNVSLAVGAFGVQCSVNLADYHFFACSFDSVRLVVVSGQVSTHGCHFEDGGPLTTTSLVVQASPGGDWTSDGDTFMTRSATAGAVQVGFGRATIGGRWVAAGLSGLIAPWFVTISGGGSCLIDMNDTQVMTNVFSLFMGTSTGVSGVLPLPETLSLDRGDTSVVVAPMKDYQTQFFNTPLTGNRTVTVNALGLTYYGLKIRVVRTVAATGVSTLTVAGKALAVGQWADAVVTQSGTLVETAFGSL